MLKFIYSEKATKFCEIFPLLLTTVHTVKGKGKISQNFVAFSEYMNFTSLLCWTHQKVLRKCLSTHKSVFKINHFLRNPHFSIIFPPNKDDLDIQPTFLQMKLSSNIVAFLCSAVGNFCYWKEVK